MADYDGTFCWNELATNNLKECKKFFTDLLGWTSEDSDMGGTKYTVFKQGEKMVGGMMAISKDWGDVPPHWMGYIAVDDVDSKAKKVEELGGKVNVPPTDIPTVGRFCVITDPGGAVVSLITMEQK
jgi:predicted enzyme related to lactoylglutathione lyase